MSARERLRRRRAKLWHANDGRCFWCGVVTVLPAGAPRRGVPAPQNLATIDHLDDRYSPARGTMKGEERTVLACGRCNNERQKIATRAQPKNWMNLASGAHKSWPPKVREHRP